VVGYVFFFAAFCLAKIFSAPGSRWDIPWAAVAWGQQEPL